MNITFERIALAVLVVVVIILILTRPKRQPEIIKGKVEHEARMKEHQVPYDSAQNVIDSILLRGRLDSIRTGERILKYQRDIARLQSKLKSLDFSKSTDKQLDSLIFALYGE